MSKKSNVKRGADSQQRRVRPECDSHSLEQCKAPSLQSTECDHLESERILLGALNCQYAADLTAGKGQNHRLKELLSRWRQLGLPRPEFRIVSKPPLEWLGEFQRFLESYVFKSNAKVSDRADIEHGA